MPTRCPWAESHPLLQAYHDQQWGVQVRDRHTLYEFLVLEGAQAGLSWLSVLHRRGAYSEAFAGFDPGRVAVWGVTDVERLLQNPALIRNRAKLNSALNNARAFLRVERAFNGFDQYLDALTGGRTIHHYSHPTEVRSSDALSERLSRDLVGRGFSFVGPTICYSYLQAVGWIMDHLTICFRYSVLNGN